MYFYVRYLNPWFQRALKGDDDSQKELGELFAQMHEYDGDMMKGIDGLAKWLSDKAERTLNMVNPGKKFIDNGQVDEGKGYFHTANEIILHASKEIMPLRRKTSDGLSKLQALKGEMIGITGAI